MTKDQTIGGSTRPRFATNVRLGALLIDLLRLCLVLWILPVVLVAAVGALSARRGLAEMEATFSALSSLFSVTVPVGTVAQIASMIVGVVWLNRCYANQRALGYEPRYTSAVSRWWWLIPVLNLLRAYQMITEVWSTSRIEQAPGNRSVLVWWWAAFVAMSVLSFSDVGMLWPRALSTLLAITAALLGIKMVRWVTIRQELAVPPRIGGALGEVLAAQETPRAVTVSEQTEPSPPFRSVRSRVVRVAIGRQEMVAEADCWTAGNSVIECDEIQNISVRRELLESVVAGQRYAVLARTGDAEFPIFRELLPGEAHAARRVLRGLVMETRVST